MPKSKEDQERDRRNPFVYQTPVPPDRFVGRQQVLDEVFRLVVTEPTGDCVVLGSTRIGKSSLAKRLQHRRALTDYCERQKANDIAKSIVVVATPEYPKIVSRKDARAMRIEFWERFMNSLVGAVRDANEAKVGLLATQQRRFRRVPPLTSEDLGRVGEILAKVELQVAVVFDDFDDLIADSRFDGDFFDALIYLRGYSEGRVRFVFLTDIDPGTALASRGDLRDIADLLIGYPPVIELGSLTHDEVSDLLKKGPAPDFFTEKEDQKIWEEGGGHPFLTQALAYYALEKKRELKKGQELQEPQWQQVYDDLEKDDYFQDFLQSVYRDLLPDEIMLIRKLGWEDRPGQQVKGPKWAEVLKGLKRKAIVRLRQEDEPFLFEYYDPSISEVQEYTKGARFLWRLFEKRLPLPRKERRPRRPLVQLDWLQIGFVNLGVYLVTWIVLYLNYRTWHIDPLWAFIVFAWIPVWIPFYLLYQWIRTKVRGL